MDDLVTALEDTVRRSPPNWPGLTGYCGWNYECATLLYAFQANLDLDLGLFTVARSDLERFLRAATVFPQPGAFIELAFWYFTPGDRIGLFGSLYHYFYDTIAKSRKIVTVVDRRLKLWAKPRGVYARKFSWGIFFGYRISLVSNFLWIDDSFMGGLPLVHGQAAEYGRLLLSYHDTFRDAADGLYWHGLKLGWPFGTTAKNNGVKWARGNGWLLLSTSTFLLHTRGRADLVDLRARITELLTGQIDSLLNFQRGSGAFGNIVNDDTSPDETSLTSVLVFAIAILELEQEGALLDASMHSAAQSAWDFLKTRPTDPGKFALGDTCAGQSVSTDPYAYNRSVGLSDGPGVALLLYAMIGKELLGLS